MKKLVLFAIVAIVLSGCAADHNRELAQQSFIDYAENDMPDYIEFVDLNYITAIDTLNKLDMLPLVDALKQSIFYNADSFPYETQRIDQYQQIFWNEPSEYITYEIEVCEYWDSCGSERKHYKSYYAIISNDSTAVIQEHQMLVDEAPALYKGFYDFCENLLGY